ncbi:MAG: 1-deoxy-D-xylulose-5-phosphate reductoisomerase, partial [Burkholderiales bacterium]
MQAITLLGSTGSIGTHALSVIARHPQRYRVLALSAHTRADALVQQCLQFRPAYAVLS